MGTDFPDFLYYRFSNFNVHVYSKKLSPQGVKADLCLGQVLHVVRLGPYPDPTNLSRLLGWNDTDTSCSPQCRGIHCEMRGDSLGAWWISCKEKTKHRELPTDAWIRGSSPKVVLARDYYMSSDSVLTGDTRIAYPLTDWHGWTRRYLKKKVRHKQCILLVVSFPLTYRDKLDDRDPQRIPAVLNFEERWFSWVGKDVSICQCTTI